MALLTLISNRAAALRALPPSAIKPITRSLKSCEYGAGISPPMASSRRSFANHQAPENPSLYVSTRSETALMDNQQPQQRVFPMPVAGLDARRQVAGARRRQVDPAAERSEPALQSQPQ